MEVIDANKQGLALIVDRTGRLVGTVTDGDIRRFILTGASIEEPVTKVMMTQPLTLPAQASPKKAIEIMKKSMVRNIPLLDSRGRPQGLINLSDVISDDETERVGVIMAGGEGKRLRPLTEDIPKPMVKIGGKPILENIIAGFAEVGIRKIYISLNYKAHVIQKYFGDGSRHGVAIEYLIEKKKLGTAGALALLPERPFRPIVVINGDVITRTNFLRLLEFHKEHKCVMTVAAVQYKFRIPYGVLKLSGHYLLGIEEKPQKRFFCNAGVYVLNPEVLDFILENEKTDMSDVIEKLVRKGLPLSIFPVHEYWVDIGDHLDLKKAMEGTPKEQP